MTLKTEEAKDLKKCTNPEEINNVLKKTTRTVKWYEASDEKLSLVAQVFKKLSNYPNRKVRLELVDLCRVFIEKCIRTIPKTTTVFVDILIGLSEDEDLEIRVKSAKILQDLSAKITENSLRQLLENIEDNFYNTITSLPRIFNGIDEQEKLRSLNLIIGFIRIFNDDDFSHAARGFLRCPDQFKHLISTLLQISELEKGNVSLLEDQSTKDLELLDSKTPWKKFRFFSEEKTEEKLREICRLLGRPQVVDLAFDLLHSALGDRTQRKEATFLLNEIASGNAETSLTKTLIDAYLETEFVEDSIPCEVKDDVILICLQTEGVGRIALHLKQNFHQFLLRTLYVILERAGSSQPLIRLAGLQAIKNISLALGYENITELINANNDYFSFSVIKKLNRPDFDLSAFDVLNVVLSYSNIDVLPSISNVIEGLLDQSWEKLKRSNTTAYLRVFKVFLRSLVRWFDVQIPEEPIKTKAEKLQELENQHFQISNLNENIDYSDEAFSNKTAEEMYREDLEENERKIREREKEEMEQKGGVEEEEEMDYSEVYKKPEPPTHVKLTVGILQRSLNFLPSKDKARRILVLEILKDGVEIIRDF